MLIITLRINTTFCSFFFYLIDLVITSRKTAEYQSKQVAGEDSTAYKVDNPKDIFLLV